MNAEPESRTAPGPRQRLPPRFWQFLPQEMMSGLVLLVATAVALGLANSRHAGAFAAFWQQHIPVYIGQFVLNLTLGEWINEGLMVSFFLLVGLEIKRELICGELASLYRAALPAVGAFGGMVVPALLYWLVTRGSGVSRGWAIPTATDIAFTIGIMSLLGKRVPPAVKVFVTALAIVDDLGAVAIIALVYSVNIQGQWLLAAGALMLPLIVLNRLEVRSLSVYLLFGALLWGAMLKSGIHATLTGVLLGICIPLRCRGRHASPSSPLDRLEHILKAPVLFLVVPLFALANAGVELPLTPSAAWRAMHRPETLGVALGLLVGKPLGILLASFLTVRLGYGKLPTATSWRALTGAAMLCGIGFTMSLFITQLAFTGAESSHTEGAKLGIIGPSFLAALAGSLVLRLPKESPPRCAS